VILLKSQTQSDFLIRLFADRHTEAQLGVDTSQLDITNRYYCNISASFATLIKDISILTTIYLKDDVLGT
jgi:hypothetical protein